MLCLAVESTEMVERGSGWLARVVAVLRHPAVPLLLGTGLIVDAMSLPRSSLPRRIASSIGPHAFRCYMPWQVSFVRQNGELVPAPLDDAAFEVTVTLDMAYPQGTSLWAPTTRTYRTNLGVWRRDERPMTQAEHDEAKAATIAWLEAQPVDTSAYLALLKQGEGTYTFPILSGYIHNSFAGAVAIAFAVSTGFSMSRVHQARHARLAVQRGVCHRCGYDRQGLVGDARCPECGAHPSEVASFRVPEPAPPAR